MRQTLSNRSRLPPAADIHTYEELLAEQGETNRPCELWDGELAIAPAPSFHHQEIVLRFSQQLYHWVLKNNLGKVVNGPIDMILSPHRVMQAGCGFHSQERLSIIARTINGPVDLAAEVISLGDRNRDRIEKRHLYEQYGIKEYWLIDPEA